MDDDCTLEPSWTKALESVESGTRSKIIEIFVNASKVDILEAATTRWENVRNTDHVKDSENCLFPFFALRLYLEHSCEQDKTKRFIDASIQACNVPDMARRYDGLVYLIFTRETIYPKALQMHLDSKIELMSHINGSVMVGFPRRSRRDLLENANRRHRRRH